MNMAANFNLWLYALIWQNKITNGRSYSNFAYRSCQTIDHEFLGRTEPCEDTKKKTKKTCVFFAVASSKDYCCCRLGGFRAGTSPWIGTTQNTNRAIR